jgi:hypothetical protein
MYRWIAILTLAALLLALACPALAEEAKEAWEVPVTDEELLGVWKAECNEDLEILILPGSYAPVSEKSRIPYMYAEGRWQENDGRQVVYQMCLNRQATEGNGLLNSLFGSTLANAVKVIGSTGETDKDLDVVAGFDYDHANIGVQWPTDDEPEYYIFTDKSSGTIYAFHDEDMSVTLYWMDNYDPHASGEILHRVTTIEAPSAEELSSGVLTPVIDMADDDAAQTALALIDWVSKNKCMRMDGAALAENLRAAYAALEPDKARVFRDNYARITDVVSDAMGLSPENRNDSEGSKPFTDTGLGRALDFLTSSTKTEAPSPSAGGLPPLTLLASSTETVRAMELLNDAILEAMGEES